MSEMTLITKQYSDIVDFTSKVNKSIIVFKKKSLLKDKMAREKYPGLEVSEKEVKEATNDLLSSLVELETLGEKGGVSDHLAGLSDSSDLKQLVTSNQTDRKEIEQIVRLLEEGKELSNTNFRMLDKIIGVLDNERNILFRKMRTARG